jgi:tetratricopeptide (TPR) repeat protein
MHKKTLILLLLTTVWAPALMAVARDETATTPSPTGVQDVALTASQDKLLTLAFEAASAIPLAPHIKDRARTQKVVIDACIELDQPQRAARYIKKVPNWRRGTGWAELGSWYALRGQTESAHHCVARAEKVMAETEDWRRNRIRTKIAKAYARLGELERAEQTKPGEGTAEHGKVMGVKAAKADPNAFDEHVRLLDELLAKGELDTSRNALWSYTELYDRFYDDPEKRSLIAERIRSAYRPLPLFIRIDLLLAIADTAVEHGDDERALALVGRAHELADDARWPARYHVPLLAKLAKAYQRAGGREKAGTLAKQAFELFQANRTRIADIYRSEALRPVAEAYHELGDRENAADVYAEALEQGAVNPNARPRAEDLAATCASMAVHEFEPDAELWSHIRQIRDGLRAPW